MKAALCSSSKYNGLYNTICGMEQCEVLFHRFYTWQAIWTLWISFKLVPLMNKVLACGKSPFGLSWLKSALSISWSYMAFAPPMLGGRGHICKVIFNSLSFESSACFQRSQEALRFCVCAVKLPFNQAIGLFQFPCVASEAIFWVQC